MCYFDIKKYEKAIQDFERCREGNNATGGSLHYVKGITYYKLRKPIEAILAF
jgi:tetratricopeptide (TPR) repeat protein